MPKSLKTYQYLTFQSTLPQGERPIANRYMTRANISFNPRSRKGSDRSKSDVIWAKQSFNPRSRKGSDVLKCGCHMPYDGFQSTLPQGERRSKNYNPLTGLCFNPRSRKGSDIPIFTAFLTLYVSIHAPARGATDGQRNNRGSLQVSIHAPARGATVFQKFLLHRHSCFNPRSRKGSDVC